MNDMPRPVHILRGTGAMAAIYADFDARVSNVEIAKKHGVRTETIRRHQVKWRGDGKRPIDGPSKAQIEREAQARRDADLAASARRAALLATKGETVALIEWRAKHGRLENRSMMTMGQVQAAYDAEFQKRKK